ncbi:MAG: hypothetical protein M0C28_22860 [Candidatus Moduliflexus flocculans]|nr:hypothetical protein [Candidatus Moduliflexus flocculans]
MVPRIPRAAPASPAGGSLLRGLLGDSSLRQNAGKESRRAPGRARGRLPVRGVPYVAIPSRPSATPLSHVMAEAVVKLYPGTKVAIGPAIEDGFYYDFQLPAAHPAGGPAGHREGDAAHHRRAATFVRARGRARTRR